MAFSSANSDVNTYVGITAFSTATQPTLTEVNNIIGQVDGEITAVMAGVGITTFTNESLLELLKKYSAMASAGLVIMRYGKSEMDIRKAEFYYNDYLRWLDKLTKDDKYKESILNLTNSAYSDILIGNQVTDCYFTESDSDTEVKTFIEPLIEGVLE